MDRPTLKAIGMSSILWLKGQLSNRKTTGVQKTLILIMMADQWHKLEDLHAEIKEENPDSRELHELLDEIVADKTELMLELMEDYKKWKQR